MMGTPGKSDESAIQNKQTNTEKYVFLLQCHINSHKSWKKHEKNINMTFCDVPIV